MSDAAAVRPFAEALRIGREEVARRWLERIAARVAIDKAVVFPSEDLLDEVPILIEGIARFLAEDIYELSVNLPVVLKAKELGRLRQEQGFSARQILWEYEILSGVILQFFDELDPVLGMDSVPALAVRRLLLALNTVQRAAVEEFVERAEEVIREREERLRGFNRAVTHELRNDVGAILGAARMLSEAFVLENPDQHNRFVSMIIGNGERLEVVLHNLLELARIDLDTRRNRHVLLRHAAEEVARRLRSFADTRGVRIEIADHLPAVEVNAAAVDFCLTNLIANGIKYSDPARPERYVRVVASSSTTGDRPIVVIEVTDNGRGVPELDRPRLFERFYRAENALSEEGTGLGLALVRDIIERTGGKAWAEFTISESVFVFTLPARREQDKS